MAKYLAQEKSCSEYFLASLKAYGKSSYQAPHFTKKAVPVGKQENSAKEE